MKFSFKKCAAFALTALLTLAGAASPVHATGVTYTPITGQSKAFYSYLVMDSTATTPAVTFNYTITPISDAIPASGGSPKITPGPSGASIGTAAFTANQGTFDTVQAMGDNVTVKKTSDATDDVTLTGDKKYARSLVTVNFSSVSFNEPGIYRWTITETNPSSPGITYDSSTKYIDVYVVDSNDGNNTLSIDSYVLHTNGDSKASGFENTFTSYDLGISASVSGNQASRDEYFKVTVSLTDAGAGRVINIAGNADSTPITNGINGTMNATNPATITADGSGEVSQDFWIQGGQNIVLKDLAPGTKYTVSEDDTTLNNEGYTTTPAKSEDSATISGRTVSNTTSGIAADATVSFANAKNGTVPTGIITSVLPGIGLLAIAAGGFAVFSKRRKEDDE